MDSGRWSACRRFGLLAFVVLLSAPLGRELITAFESLMSLNPFFRFSFQVLEHGVIA